MRIVSMILYAAAAITFLVPGIEFLLTRKILNYHEQAVGKWESINSELQLLLLVFMRIIASTWISLAILMFALILIPFKNKENWANWALAIPAFITALTILSCTLIIKNRTGANTPWAISIVRIVIIIIAFFLSLIK